MPQSNLKPISDPRIARQIKFVIDQMAEPKERHDHPSMPCPHCGFLYNFKGWEKCEECARPSRR